MSNHPHKKPRLIIIKKEQDKSTPNRAKLAPLGGAPPGGTPRSSPPSLGGTPTNRAKLAPLGGAPPGGTPLPLERSSPPSLGGTPRSCAVLGRLPPPLACTRFNNKTWQEYQDWLNANQQTYEHIYKRPLKCIYGAP